MNRAEIKIALISVIFLCLTAFCPVGYSQSRDQNFPTPIASNEIKGTIKARDVGDSRLTSYYYVFEGTQGDIFINLLTNNFSGDVDIFTLDGLKTLSKVVIFPESGLSETGRLVYLRKPEKLMLRIQGRTPNDDSATYQIKFGGSFVAMQGQKEESAPSIEPAAEKSGVVVNTVGTIVKTKPNPTPGDLSSTDEKRGTAKADDVTAKPKTDKGKDPALESKPNPAVAVDPKAKAPAIEPSKVADLSKANSKSEKDESRDAKKPDSNSNTRLVIQLKDGKTIERLMSQVLKFSVDGGVMTVISKGGSIAKYSMLDVAKVTIQ